MKWLAAVVLLSSCATSYQPKGFTGGYSETWLSDRAVEVSFEGNGYTRVTAARRGALTRAAELAARMGFFGFWVSSQQSDVDTSAISQPMSCNAATGNCVGGQTTIVNRPTASIVANMVTFDEARYPPPPGIVVYDARRLLAAGY